jgi:molybdopterin converting factor small subunit
MVTVEFFGHLRLRVGHDTLQIDVQTPLELGTLIREIAREYPVFAEIVRDSPPVIAVNRQVVADSHLVSPGETITIFPPISGG